MIDNPDAPEVEWNTTDRSSLIDNLSLSPNAPSYHEDVTPDDLGAWLYWGLFANCNLPPK